MAGFMYNPVMTSQPYQSMPGGPTNVPTLPTPRMMPPMPGLQALGDTATPTTAADTSGDVTPVAQRSTPARLARRLKWSEQLMQPDTSPTVGYGASPIVQGLARVATNLYGGYETGRVEDQYQQAQQNATAQFEKMLKGGGTMDDASLARIMTDPFASEPQQKYAAAVLESHLPSKDRYVAVGDRLYDVVSQKYVNPGAASGGLAPPGSETLSRLNTMWEGNPQVIRYRAVQPAIAEMHNAINRPDEINDISFVTGLVKALDPHAKISPEGGPGGWIMDGGSIPDVIVGRINKLVAGKSTLGPRIRGEIYNLARDQLLQVYSGAKTHHDTLDKYMKTQGYDTQYLTPLEPLPPAFAGEAPAISGEGGGDSNTLDDFNNIPDNRPYTDATRPGRRFIKQNGQEMEIR